MDNLTSVEVCYMLGIAESTLRNWIKWYKQDGTNCPELPLPHKVGNKNYWNRSDMGKMFAFRDWVPHGRNGRMGSVNRKYWKKCTKTA